MEMGCSKSARCMSEGVKFLRYSLFWDVTQRRLVVSFRHFGRTCQCHLQGSDSPRHR